MSYSSIVKRELDLTPDELEAKLASKKAELRDLATMGAVITSIHEINSVLSVVMDMAIRLADGEVGLIMLEEEDKLVLKISWGVQESFVRSLVYRNNTDLPTYCYQNRETVILNDLGVRDEGGIAIDSIICLPIQTADHCHGVMLMINKANGGGFDDENRESLEMLLNFVAVAIDNSLLLEEQLGRQKIEQEMTIAREIQGTILPHDIAEIPGCEIGAVYFPAREVGGDFYQTHQIDEKRFLVILGDVSNKGVPAALVMAAAAGIMKSIVTERPSISISGLAMRLNDLLVEEIIKEREMFITMFFAKFDLEDMKITYCNGGHLPGLFWSNDEQKIVELSEGGPIVGQFGGVTFKEGSRSIASGDRLFLFTDGLTEAEDAEGRMFGRERAEQVFSAEVGLEPAEFCMKVKEWVDRFNVGSSEDSHDDFTILQVKVE
ncbi:MAG: SpoIIE family protein phosphatase [candidate division Zixibacteria bacterium]|nr:SpoIIE family protein phosphatase [candidate division Zixibacteria bacterium]